MVYHFKNVHDVFHSQTQRHVIKRFECNKIVFYFILTLFKVFVGTISRALFIYRDIENNEDKTRMCKSNVFFRCL